MTSLKKTLINSILYFICPFLLSAQNDTIKYDLSALGVVSSGAYSPFWINSKQYGKISDQPFGTDVMVGMNKDFSSKKSLFDYGFKADALLQTDNNQSKVYFHELYAKARLSVFDLVVGAREEHLGNQDSTLSCGGFLFSQNSRPMPKISIGIEHFTAVPFTNGFLEIKGALTHGWFTDNNNAQNVFLHHKYGFFRLGGRHLFHFQYGLDHVAQWGGYIPGLGQQPTSFHDFKTIFLGGSGGSDALVTDQINALGNHILSQSMKFELKVSEFAMNLFWQNISEDGPIKIMWNSMNRYDGLVGFSIRNKNFPIVKGILYEFLNTQNQSGPFHDQDGIVYGGTDSYFANGVYTQGWSYFSRTIGTPFIFNKYNDKYIQTNNRVQVHHFGIEGELSGYQYKAMSSFSKNYGTYSEPINIENTSVMLEVKKHFQKLSNIELGFTVGADFGKLYGNTVGVLFSIRKTGDLFHY
ncbi:MAG: hypothetical protein WCG93_00930 [Paludibacter sp.]